MELSRFFAGATPAAKRNTVYCELLNAVVASLHHIKRAFLSEGQIVGVRELSRFGTRLAPTANQLSLFVENLNAMIGRVGHIKIAIRTEAQRPNSAELPRFGSRAAPVSNEFASQIKLGNAVILKELRKVEIPFTILNGVAYIAELSGPGARLATDDAQLAPV